MLVLGSVQFAVFIPYQYDISWQDRHENPKKGTITTLNFEFRVLKRQVDHLLNMQ